MRTIAFIIIMAISSQGAFSQSDSVLKFIFVPHPRSENRSQQSVLPAIEKIDFSKYDMTLLGGDLTYYTSINRMSMEYCDSLFKLNNPNTLWTLGNHDRNNLKLIEEFTGRKSFNSYYRDKITFVVLDTEREANGFQSTFIRGEQLEMLENVCDTINNSECLFILHHRLIWMIGNEDFSERIDSVGESTKQLDTTNFYQDVYPLIIKAKSKGVKVICLGGDKSKINIDYSPADSIFFLTSTMAPEFADSLNCVIVFTVNPEDKSISWEFVSLELIEKVEVNSISLSHLFKEDSDLTIRQCPGNNEVAFQLLPGLNKAKRIEVYSISGVLLKTFTLEKGEIIYIPLNYGVYIAKETTTRGYGVSKFIVH